MDIILLKDYDGLGDAGDVVNVKPGFARNKLIPEGVALRASKRNLAIAKERKKTAHTRREREKATYDSLVKTLSKTEITIEAKVGEEDKMFGSVTAIDIHKSLEDQGIEVDRHAILLDEPIKALGIYHVPVRVASNLNGDVKIYVIKS
jgi:large subunit ribosomal protein L9|tara:strand:+ start:2543 stop:2986 length:444 start_codon:yes stop_codon:yes gene_type:complete